MIENANNNDVAVFNVIASPLNMYVNTVNTVMPHTNATNLPGQNNPSNPDIEFSVAYINIYVIGMPSNAIKNLYFFHSGHTIGPFNCIQTNICPNKNNNIEKVINL